MNKIFRTLIFVGGHQVEIHPRVPKISEAMGRALDVSFISLPYRWEVHEITIYGDSKCRLEGSVPAWQK